MQLTTALLSSLAVTATETTEAAAHSSGHNITHMMMHLILQLAVIIIVAKIDGFLCQRFLKMPSVLVPSQQIIVELNRNQTMYFFDRKDAKAQRERVRFQAFGIYVLIRPNHWEKSF